MGSIGMEVSAGGRMAFWGSDGHMELIAALKGKEGEHWDGACITFEYC